MFAAIYAPDSGDALIDVAHEFSPRVAGASCAPGEVVLDLAGLARLFGSADTIAEEIARTAAERGLRVRVAIAATQTAARLLVRHRSGLTVVARGGEAAAIAGLPVHALEPLAASAVGERAADAARTQAPAGPGGLTFTLARWGVRTLGALAALPADALAARLGPEAVRWHRMARGEDLTPLVPDAPAERFEQALDLEWPIEGLEPLSFVLGRLLEPLAAHLARRDRGAAVLHVRLHLVTREVYERSLQLPIPMRDARTLRTLILLDLESHPPAAGIDRVVVAVDPTPARVVQFSLLARPQPAPEQISTLMARLQALMGETRCGSPADVDTWQPGAWAMTSFAPPADAAPRQPAAPVPLRSPPLALRRFRPPIVARVHVEGGVPVRVGTDRADLPGGRVEAYAGPWRTSGAWWLDAPVSGGGIPAGGVAAAASPRHRWDRDEWDVSLAGGGTYRIVRDRATEVWFVEGYFD